MATRRRRRLAKRIARPATSTAQKVASQVRTILGIEKKNHDVALSSSAIVTSNDGSGLEQDPTTVNCLNAIAQGDSASNREGRAITLHSIFVKGHLTFSAVADQADVLVSPVIDVWLVLDKQTNKAQLNSEDVFLNAVGTANGTPCMQRQLNFSKRFQVLAHKQFSNLMVESVTDGTNTSSQCLPAQTFEFGYNWTKGLPVEYNLTTAAIEAITDNSLHIIAGTTSTTFTPRIHYHSRIRFTG